MSGGLPWPASKMGSWTVDGQLMTGPGFKPLNFEILEGQAPQKGGNEDVPGDDGRLAREHFLDQLVADVMYQVGGKVTQAGVPYGDELFGLRSNLAILNAICTPPDIGDERTSVIARPGFADATAGIQLSVSLPARETGAALILRVVVTVTIPQGSHFFVGGS